MNTRPDLPLVLLPDRLAVSRLPAEAPIPDWARTGNLLALVRTRDELSVVCEERFVPPEIRSEKGWRALQVQGPLDFTSVGILTSIASPLAAVGVSIFAISTYDTDFILFKESQLERTLQALNLEGILVVNGVDLPT